MGKQYYGNDDIHMIMITIVSAMSLVVIQPSHTLYVYYIHIILYIYNYYIQSQSLHPSRSSQYSIIRSHFAQAKMLAPLWSSQPRKRRRKGGWRQQAARAAIAEEPEDSSISFLAAGHLLEWCDGVESATQVRNHMRNALRDGFNHPMVKRLADMGGSSNDSQHCHQGLIQLLEMCGIDKCLTSLPPPSGVSGLVLPSTIIRILHSNYPAMFKTRLGANERMLDNFWEQFIKRPENVKWASTHPALLGKSPRDLRRTIPCSLHEDAGPISKTLSADCVSWSAFLGDGDEKVTHYLSWSDVKEKLKDVNVDIAWDAFLKDFEELATGYVDGSPVARDSNGAVWSFALLFSKGDEECHCNTWGLTHWQNAVDCCSECLANRTSRPFTDLRGVAAWRGSEEMPTEHYLARVRQPLHPIMASPFFTRWCCFPDLMHMMDCKGVTATVLGGLLHYLLTNVLLGSNRDIRLATINAKMKEWYDAHPGSHRIPRILMGNTTLNGWAELHGPAIKAANTRSAVGPFKAIWAEYARADDELDSNASVVINSLATFYDILYTAPMFMSDECIERLQVVCITFGRLFTVP